MIRRRPLAVALACLALSLFLPAAPPLTDSGSLWRSASAAVPRAKGVTMEAEADGFHYRMVTPNGPIHLFRPRGYVRRGGGVVVYVHGYYLHVDQAWNDHKLATQFAASGRNALFIAPEAPASPEEQPRWENLRALVGVALKRARLRWPTGPLVVVGHSGAYRTIVPWLNEATLHDIVLVDALYANEQEFRGWLDQRPTNRMTLVVKGTTKLSDPFVKDLPDAVTAPKIPKTIDQFTDEERQARVLYVKSQYGHFELITEGNTLPVILGRPPTLGAVRPPRRPKLAAAPP